MTNQTGPSNTLTPFFVINLNFFERRASYRGKTRIEKTLIEKT